MFIVLEGLDGAGKSTQIKMLEQHFTKQNKKCNFLHFPRFDTPIFGEMIAKFLRGDFGKIDEVNPYIVALLFAEDRRDAADTIKKLLNEDYIVIADRYVYSNIAYQCAKLDNEEERKKLRNWILNLEFEHFKIPKPDISVFLDVPFSFTQKNLEDNRSGNDREYLEGKQDIHEESLDLQLKVREMYLEQQISEPKFKVVKCQSDNSQMLAPEETFKKILNTLGV